MVTSVPFYSFKDINFRRSVPFWAVLIVVLALIVISTNPPLVLFGLFVAYALSGYVLWAWNWRKARRSV
jgi:CDP-diacylglycerol--serine O-phosphatidyltransferase